MYYRSTINYFLFVFRIIFILICFFFLLALLNIFPLLYEDRRTPLIGKLLLGITGGMGMCWGIIMTIRAIYFRTIIVTIQDKSIEIHQVFKRKKVIIIRQILKRSQPVLLTTMAVGQKE